MVILKAGVMASFLVGFSKALMHSGWRMGNKRSSTVHSAVSVCATQCLATVRVAHTNRRRSSVLSSPEWPKEWPYSATDFARQDESRDSEFYSMPRFVYHIDDRAVAALTKYYDQVFRQWERPEVLDICASHVSHFPEDCPLGPCVALGMNEIELKENRQVDRYVVRDLNQEPSLPFGEDEFDIVTCAVSIDYLTRPREVCAEIGRVLRPGGVALLALSNRCFPSKAISIWLRTNDLEHIFITASFLHYSGMFKPAEAVEISPVDAPWSGGTSQNVAYLAVVRAQVAK